MTNYLRRIEALEARHSPAAELPWVIVFLRDGDDAEAVKAEALRARGLNPDEARLMVVSFAKSDKRLR